MPVPKQGEFRKRLKNEPQRHHDTGLDEKVRLLVFIIKRVQLLTGHINGFLT